MNRPAVAKVQALADEVSTLCKEVELIERANDALRKKPDHKYYEEASTGKANAALKRRSLDLTRALAEMRKP